jgi:hypothetical protein
VGSRAARREGGGGAFLPSLRWIGVGAGTSAARSSLTGDDRLRGSGGGSLQIWGCPDRIRWSRMGGEVLCVGGGCRRRDAAVAADTDSTSGGGGGGRHKTTACAAVSVWGAGGGYWRPWWVSVFKPVDLHRRYPQQRRRWGSP